MKMGNLKYFQAWDLPTRLFHWINFACVLSLSAIGTAILFDKELGVTDAGKLILKTTHVWFGYIFVLNLIWRIVWAFFGDKNARWSALLPFQAGYVNELKAYVRGMMRGDAPRYAGHNPIARAMVTLLFVLLLVQGVTGLVLAGTDIYYPPFGSWIAAWISLPGVDPSTIVAYNKDGVDPAAMAAMRAFRSPFVNVHYWTFYTLVAAVVIHIAGVIVTESREGGGIVSAMFTGQKAFDRPPVDDTESKS